MTGQVNLCFWVAAFCAIVHGYAPVGSLNLNETFYVTNDTMTLQNIKESDGTINVAGITPAFSTDISNITSKDETMVNKPIHVMYPHAVLFGESCGGTIISPTWIITAAHCTIRSAGRTVLAGTNNTKEGTIVLVKRRVMHPLFMVGPYWLSLRQYGLSQVRVQFDYLLVELEEPLPLNGITMKAAKLNETYELAPGMNVSFAGYGGDNLSKRIYSMNSVMFAKKFELQTEDECARIYGYNNKDIVCAKGSPPNFDFACYGDSGSGLVDENGVLIGVTSWVDDEEEECPPGAMVYFAKIAAVREWIREITNV